MIDILLEALELGAQRGQVKVIFVDFRAIQTEFCDNLVSACLRRPCFNSVARVYGSEHSRAIGGGELTLEFAEPRLDLDTLGRFEMINPWYSHSDKVFASPGVRNRGREALGKTVNACKVAPNRNAQWRRFHVLGSNR